MKAKRKIIQIDPEKCDGCGLCVPSCAEGAIQIADGKAKLVAEKFCDGLGACLGECPRGALQVIEREAEEFDEHAVEEHLKSQEAAPAFALASGCPSAAIRDLGKPKGPPQPLRSAAPAQGESALTHWPVQIRLVPPTAPFLKGADLLVAADCTPVAYPNFHRDFLDGKVVMLGCPKFDDVQSYVQKFTDIFSGAGVKSVTVVTMEVPCCQGLPMIVRKAMELSGKKFPLEQVTVGVQGEILRTQRLVA